MKRIDRGSPRPGRGFTLIEILMVTAIAVFMVGTASMLLVQFKRSFTKGEETSIVIQEGGMFLAILRNDFINAVFDARNPLFKTRWWEAIKVEPETLSFQIYKDAEGTIEPVLYIVESEKSPGAGKSISRSQAGGKPKILIDQRIASLTWSVGSDTYSGIGSGVRQIWLNIDLTIGGQGKQGTKSKVINLSTKLFPTRMNRQINGSE